MKAKLFNTQTFFSRQVILRELGSEGQDKLIRSRVAIVGVGGLGSASALYLALAGVGFLRLIDQDTVELHNLHRQVLYELKDIRYPKVEAAARRIKRINPQVKVDLVPDNLYEGNVRDLINGVDVVVDGLDNMKTRYLINRVCADLQIPYVFAGAIGLEGNISVFAPPETPCLECVLPSLEDGMLPTCDVRGVLGATTGIVGAIQAMETIKLLASMGNSLKGKLLICDFKTMEMFKVEVFKRPDCPVCQGKHAQRPGLKERLVWLCGQKTANINPPRPIILNLDEIYSKLRGNFKILLKSSLALVFKYSNDVEISLFKNGRMLIKNIESEEEALTIYGDIAKYLGVLIA